MSNKFVEPNNFLDSFHKSLQSLATFNDNLAQAIASDKQNKDDFLQYVNTELGSINNKIKSLEGLINAINDELNKLRAASDENVNIMNNNNASKAALEQKITELEATKAELNNQLMEANAKSNQLQTELQRQIDAKEAQISQLTGENESLKNESVALQTQLTERSQTDAQQAAAIQKLTEEHQQALDKQMSENNAKIEQLTTEIQDRDKKINDMAGQNSSQLNSIQAELDKCTQSQAETLKQIDALNSTNQQLQETNNLYKENIESATQIINDTVGKLNSILQQIPNSQDRNAIGALFKEINDEIEKLSGLLQGQKSMTASSQYNNNDNNDNDTSIIVGGVTNDALMSGKTKKIYRKNNNNKKNKMKSRRKKQKGGFTYNKPHMFFNKNSTYKSSAKLSVARGRKSVKKTIR